MPLESSPKQPMNVQFVCLVNSLRIHDINPNHGDNACLNFVLFHVSLADPCMVHLWDASRIGNGPNGKP